MKQLGEEAVWSEMGREKADDRIEKRCRNEMISDSEGDCKTIVLRAENMERTSEERLPRRVEQHEETSSSRSGRRRIKIKSTHIFQRLLFITLQMTS